MRMTQKLIGVSVLAMMAGCSTLNSLNPFASKPKTAVPAPLLALKGSMAVRTAWKLDVGKANGYIFSPAVAGDSVIVAGGSGAIARIDGASGKALWRIKAPTALSAGVGTDGNVLVVGGLKGAVYAYDMNGKALWTAQASSEVLTAPVVGDGIVVVRSFDNRIVGLDAKTGEKKWTVQRPSPPLTIRNAPGMVVAGKDVIVAQPGGKLVAILLASGSPRWEVAVGEARGATELERVTDIGGMPVVIDNEVCAVSYQGRVGCFELSTGSARWTKELSSNGGVAVDQTSVFAANDKGDVLAFARDTGVSSWKNDKLGYRNVSTPVSYGRTVAVGDYQGYIHFMSREDGTFLARAATDGSAVVATPVVVGSNLIFQTQNGTVTAIAVE
ncbi:outer membrane protein assembly factor BamB [Massilia sp. PWRC2]|uniref:outer membrane protein assembly factor BamB n=1 Tax=Massilia sp. PWRC2 TaxID=2804626 RepID=UPI003CF31E98